MNTAQLEDNELRVTITRDGRDFAATASFEMGIDDDLYVLGVKNDATGAAVQTTWQERHTMIKVFRAILNARKNDRY